MLKNFTEPNINDIENIKYHIKNSCLGTGCDEFTIYQLAELFTGKGAKPVIVGSDLKYKDILKKEGYGYKNEIIQKILEEGSREEHVVFHIELIEHNQRSDYNITNDFVVEKKKVKGVKTFWRIYSVKKENPCGNNSEERTSFSLNAWLGNEKIISDDGTLSFAMVIGKYGLGKNLSQQRVIDFFSEKAIFSTVEDLNNHLVSANIKGYKVKPEAFSAGLQIIKGGQVEPQLVMSKSENKLIHDQLRPASFRFFQSLYQKEYRPWTEYINCTCNNKLLNNHPIKLHFGTRECKYLKEVSLIFAKLFSQKKYDYCFFAWKVINLENIRRDFYKKKRSNNYIDSETRLLNGAQFTIYLPIVDYKKFQNNTPPLKDDQSHFEEKSCLTYAELIGQFSVELELACRNGDILPPVQRSAIDIPIGDYFSVRIDSLVTANTLNNRMRFHYIHAFDVKGCLRANFTSTVLFEFIKKIIESRKLYLNQLKEEILVRKQNGKNIYQMIKSVDSEWEKANELKKQWQEEKKDKMKLENRQTKEDNERDKKNHETIHDLFAAQNKKTYSKKLSTYLPTAIAFLLLEVVSITVAIGASIACILACLLPHIWVTMFIASVILATLSLMTSAVGFVIDFFLPPTKMSGLCMAMSSSIQTLLVPSKKLTTVINERGLEFPEEKIKESSPNI